MVTSRTTSNSFLPAGVATSISSPTLRFSMARPIGKVAVRTSDGDFLGKLDIELVGELVDFFLELSFNFCQRIGHGRLSAAHCTLALKKMAESGKHGPCPRTPRKEPL